MWGHVISELSILLRIFANSLIAHTLYNRRFTLIFVMWDHFCLFLCVDDVAKCGMCNRVNQIAIVDLHLTEGVRGAL